MHIPQINQVKLIKAGREYFNRLLQLIHEAEESIHLQAYIYDDDETGRLVADALKEAVKRKVDVYLMADGYASQVMSQSFIDELRRAGSNHSDANATFYSMNHLSAYDLTR